MNRPNIGYTFWLSSMKTREEYDLLIERVQREEYKLSESTVFIICDERSSSLFESHELIMINTQMIQRRDNAIASIIQSLSNRHLICIQGDDHSLEMKQSLAILITRQMREIRCTIISENISLIDMKKRDERLSSRCLSILRAVQYSKGEPITTLYRLTNYLLSSLNWNDESLAIAGVSHISEMSSSQCERILQQSSSVKGENTWDIHGYMLIRVDRLYGYDFLSRNLFSILSSLGKRGFKLFSLLLERDNSKR